MLLNAFFDSEGCYHTLFGYPAVLLGSAGHSVGKEGGYMTTFIHKRGCDHAVCWFYCNSRAQRLSGDILTNAGFTL